MTTPPLSARNPGAGVLRAAGMQQAGVAAGFTPRTKNPLLIREEVGRAKPTCYDLPDDNFSYGRPGNLDLEGAREVSMRWVSHTPSKGPEGSSADFLGLNKRATAAKITNAKDLKEFKKLTEPSTTPRTGERAAGPAKDTIPSDVIDGFTYGRKVRPSTPIQQVVSYRFAEESEKELNRFYSEFKEVQDASSRQVRKIHPTVASRGHASAAQKVGIVTSENPDLFKLSKFKKVPARVVTKHAAPSAEDCSSIYSSLLAGHGGHQAPADAAAAPDAGFQREELPPANDVAVEEY